MYWARLEVLPSSPSQRACSRPKVIKAQGTGSSKNIELEGVGSQAEPNNRRQERELNTTGVTLETGDNLDM